MKNKIKIGYIGLGRRGTSVLEKCVSEMNDVEKSSYYDSVNSENFMQMRQLSWDVAKLSDSSKAKRLVEICEEAKEENRKIIVFSYFNCSFFIG